MVSKQKIKLKKIKNSILKQKKPLPQQQKQKQKHKKQLQSKLQKIYFEESLRDRIRPKPGMKRSFQNITQQKFAKKIKKSQMAGSKGMLKLPKNRKKIKRKKDRDYNIYKSKQNIFDITVNRQRQNRKMVFSNMVRRAKIKKQTKALNNSQMYYQSFMQRSNKLSSNTSKSFKTKSQLTGVPPGHGGQG